MLYLFNVNGKLNTIIMMIMRVMLLFACNLIQCCYEWSEFAPTDIDNSLISRQQQNAIIHYLKWKTIHFTKFLFLNNQNFRNLARPLPSFPKILRSNLLTSSMILRLSENSWHFKQYYIDLELWPLKKIIFTKLLLILLLKFGHAPCLNFHRLGILT